jgi:hypothetical protein
MWEAFFAFHICIAYFLFRIRKNTWVSPRIPDRRKLLMPFGCFQVSVRILSTTLGGMECHSSSGAQHRACWSTNDCGPGIGKCGRKDVCGAATRLEQMHSMSYLYRDMSREQLLDECRLLYEREGIAAFTFEALKRHKLYFALYSKGLKLADVVNELGLGDEYQHYRETQPIRPGGRETFRWTWTRILAIAREVAEEQGSLPAAAWFQANGRGSLVASLYNLGYTWADLRGALQDFSNSNFVESRNGLRWLSHAEASLSNFLYARGIQHRKGGKYPDGYAEHSGRTYGIYDLTFLATDKQWIDVEVWGDRPHGLGDEYAAKRVLKESFNQGNNRNFLGVEYKDCYSDATLSTVLAPYIGKIEPFLFDKPTDKLIHTTHWSNADELLKYAKQIASTMPDGRFPTEEWLRKRGKWANRSGETYNTLSVYIKTWLGGIRNLRRLLDQGHVSTIEWTREKAIRAYKEFCEKHGMTPDQARQRFIKKGDLDREVYLGRVHAI